MLDRRNHCFELYHLDSAVDRFEYHQRLTSMIYGGRDRSLKSLRSLVLSFRISLSRLKNIAAQFHNHRLVGSAFGVATRLRSQVSISDRISDRYRRMEVFSGRVRGFVSLLASVRETIPCQLSRGNAFMRVFALWQNCRTRFRNVS